MKDIGRDTLGMFRVKRWCERKRGIAVPAEERGKTWLQCKRTGSCVALRELVPRLSIKERTINCVQLDGG
jgi:hypothetical protein